MSTSPKERPTVLLQAPAASAWTLPREAPLTNSYTYPLAFTPRPVTGTTAPAVETGSMTIWAFAAAANAAAHKATVTQPESLTVETLWDGKDTEPPGVA
ncbi:MAG: hypothetical protein DWI04_00975 [Planctomycetota bacterium]|nr:MAG: hypothetical protein DWI04_00975 [Planctomycetota bacterium]